MTRTNTLTKAIPRLLLLATIASPAGAAPGELQKQPLFLGTQVQPNILLIVDDSGSMNWEVLRSKGAGGGEGNRYLYFTGASWDSAKREMCAGYNVLAYDPNKTYTPWAGLDKSGNAYTNQQLTTARDDPYDDSYTEDISGHWYYIWDDKDSDEDYDSGECPIEDSDRVFVNALPTDKQTNYANWYSYYRKREYVAKKALSEIISTSKSRMGLATLHNNNSVGTIIKDIDDITVPIDTDAQTNKKALAKNLFRIYSSGGTPLRQTLQQAGKYFDVGKSPGWSLFGSHPSPSSPILAADKGGECQQNYTVLMSDGTWNGSKPSVGNADRNTANKFDGGSHADGYSNTLADVAMYYYKRDLAKDMANKVGTIEGVDENDAQHMVTYTVAFGVNGTLNANPPNRNTAFNWPKPTADNIKTIDDMRHAAWNGRGEFLSAGNADQLINRLKQAIGSIAKRESSASAVAFNSTSLRTDTMVFQARFNSGGWNGEFSANSFDSSGVGTLQWEASEKLDKRNLTASPRQIITHNGTTGIAFKFPKDYTSPQAGELSQAQIADLLTNSLYGVAATDTAEITANQTFGESIVDFLRGDLSNDGSLFRYRGGHRLGDIVNSSPFFVGAPRTRYPNAIEGTSNLYTDFIKAKKNRKPMVYVGANDGMLHAFSAADGTEVMAYIPGTLFSDGVSKGLHALAERDYIHQPYVDDSPVAADIFVNGNWATYLLGGYRAGGKGIYVLDVTDPTSLTQANAANVIKKEYTHSQLGHTFSRPQIGKLNNGRWAAIFGNGYNDDPSGDGKAKLFILYLDDFSEKIISTGVGSVVDTDPAPGVVVNDCLHNNSDCNGLSSPTILDLTADGKIDRVYAGDLHGNMWAFDLSSKNAGDWGVAYQTPAKEPKPLFTACTGSLPCAKDKRQSITAKPVVAVHPHQRRQSTEPNLLVYFGTGQYIAKNDNFSKATQSMYGVWDAGSSNAGLTRSHLQVQLISASASQAEARDVTSNTVNYGPVTTNNAKLGWYMDMPTLRERVVVDPILVGELIFFATLVPDDSVCGFGGFGYLMFVDRVSGAQPAFTVADLNNDGQFDDAIVAGKYLDAIPSSPRYIDDKIVFADSSGDIESIGVQTGRTRKSRRASWHIVK